MAVPHINRIGTAVPEHDVHAAFVTFARTLLGLVGPSRGSIRFGRRACFGRNTGTLYNRHPDGGRYVLRDVAQVTNFAQN